ncbi:hypothetical protein FB451DRAFT_1185267 [Mycena latifolia]|nr:hypothetical protein FB451DRAFT_1185267 [Mycena latifolia]
MNPASIYEVPGAKKYWRMWIIVSAGSVTQIAYMEYREASRERENDVGGTVHTAGYSTFNTRPMVTAVEAGSGGTEIRRPRVLNPCRRNWQCTVEVGRLEPRDIVKQSIFNYGTNPREDRQQLRIKNTRNIINSGTGRRGVGEKATRTPRRNEMQAAGTNDTEGRMLKNAVRHDSSIIGGCSAGAWACKGGRNGGEGGDPMIARAARGDAGIESNCAREEKNDRHKNGAKGGSAEGGKGFRVKWSPPSTLDGIGVAETLGVVKGTKFSGTGPPVVRCAGVCKLRRQAKTRNRKRGANAGRGSRKQEPPMSCRSLLGYRGAWSANERRGGGNQGAAGREEEEMGSMDHNMRKHAAITPRALPPANHTSQRRIRLTHGLRTSTQIRMGIRIYNQI